MKVRASLRALEKKDGSLVARRHGKVHVVDRRNPEWKARQG
ncbi:ribosomal protein bL36 [Nakamurella deserti]|nr:ribosomal protein bL36 [Nakamurella deserti]